MKKKKVNTFRFQSAAAPTDVELDAFSQLTPEQQREVLDTELEKGLQSGISEKTVSDVLKEVKARHRKHAV